MLLDMVDKKTKEQSLRFLGLIPARGGSKGLPGKNLAPLAGQPLIVHTIRQAMQVNMLDHLLVSSDDKEILAVAEKMQVATMQRPVSLAADHTPAMPVIRHAVKELDKIGQHFDVVVLLQPTSPLRSAADINGAMDSFLKNHGKTVVSITENATPVEWLYYLEDATEKLLPVLSKDGTLHRRQDARTCYRANGAIYVIAKERIMSAESVYSEDMIGFLMPVERSIDIDTISDLNLAEHCIKGI